MPLTRIDRVLSAMTNLRPANVERSPYLKQLESWEELRDGLGRSFAEDEREERSPCDGVGDRFGAG